MAESSQYEIGRFLAEPQSSGVPDWIDGEGRSIGRREGAVEVRFVKRVRGSVLTLRLSVEHAQRLGLIRSIT